MTKSGQIVLFRFPRTDLATAKLRPALVIGRLPGPFQDWLICMVSSQLRHSVDGFDEIVNEDAPDFPGSGLRTASVIRVGRLAVVGQDILEGATGEISAARLQRIKGNLLSWLTRL